MKVEVLLAEEFKEPMAEIKTNKITSSIEKAIELLKNEILMNELLFNKRRIFLL